MGRRPTAKALSPVLTAEMRALLDQGSSKREAARRLGVSSTTLYRLLAAAAAGIEGSGRIARGTTRPRGRRRRRDAATATAQAEDDYPESLLRRVPRDYLAMLPPGHYRALVRAAARCESAAAAVSLRQALLLHGEPLIPPPTSIELALSENEEAELKDLQAHLPR